MDKEQEDELANRLDFGNGSCGMIEKMGKDDFTWTIGGEAGFGINASGLIFSKTLARSGFNIFDYIEYPSLIRGGHNVYQVRASVREVFSQQKDTDILVALNRETFDLHKGNLKKDSFVVYDPDQFEISQRELERNKLIGVPLAKLVEKVGGIRLMVNNVALGASIALLGLDPQNLFSVIEDVFSKKGKEIVRENQKAAQLGYSFVKQNYQGLTNQVVKPDSQEEKVVLTGNEAISLGAVLGGCQFFAAYPMTPASSILHTLASWAEKVGMVVKHAEDEISVINMAIGASFAGARSAVATSGGGLALMEEGISLAGMTETPLVIVECQRPAPATGMPTWTDQGDLHFILRSGHGEFPKIVLAPGDQEEAFWQTAQSFNLADIYQTPVLVLSDKYLSESHKSIESSKLNLTCRQAGAQSLKFKIERGKLAMGGNPGRIRPYLRYKITDDGISPRLLPGTKGFYYQANSYEHKEDGHTTEDANERKKQVEKRGRKMRTFVKNHLFKPKVYGPKEAEVTLVGWGSTKMPALQAIDELQATHDTPHANYLHLNHLWPFPKETVAKILTKAKKVLLLEGNSTGQLGQLIRQETGIKIKNQYLKYNGRPFYPEEILEVVKSL